MVFKYAQSADAVQEEFIYNDVHFANILTQKYNNQFFRRFVKYTAFTIHKAGSAATVSGSLSLHYPLTLHALASRSLPADCILSIGQQVFDSISQVHSIDYSISDIKPSNLFIRSDGHIYASQTMVGTRPWMHLICSSIPRNTCLKIYCHVACVRKLSGFVAAWFMQS